MHRIPSRLRKIAACILVSAVVGPAFAKPQNITAGELALTPEYCQDVQTMNGWEKHNRAPRTPRWLAMMGETFWAMHHYCWGLIWVHRSRVAGLPRQTREYYRREAIGDYYYVVQNSKPDFVLLPEIYYRIGEAHVLLEEPVLAMEAFSKARALKPDYWPAYVAEAQVLESVGKNGDARRLIENGLAQMPDQPQLRDHLQRLGGKTGNLSQSRADLRSRPQ